MFRIFNRKHKNTTKNSLQPAVNWLGIIFLYFRISVLFFTDVPRTSAPQLSTNNYKSIFPLSNFSSEKKKIFYKQTCFYPKEIYVMFVYVTHVITCVGCLSWISGFLFRISLKSKRDLNEFFLFVVALPNSMIKEVVYGRKEGKKIK